MRIWIISFLILSFAEITAAQTWAQWATGLNAGFEVTMSIAPDHSIYYAGYSMSPAGTVWRGNTQTPGSMVKLPTVPVPASIQNSVPALVACTDGGVVAGIQRTVTTDPFLYKYNPGTNSWTTLALRTNSLGGFCAVRAPNGTLWIGGLWTKVWRSTDDGATFEEIDESTLLAPHYPCYYPTVGGNCASDGKIYGINVDKNNRVYLGTECAGLVVSDDNGASWHPLDTLICDAGNPTVQDTINNPLIMATRSGNVGGVGITADGNGVVWTGASQWSPLAPPGMNNNILFADLVSWTVSPLTGLPANRINMGQDIKKIVTTCSGQMFLFLDTSRIYTSADGLAWSLCNTGYPAGSLRNPEGGFAVEGNDVYSATGSGQIYKYTVPGSCSVENGEASLASARPTMLLENLPNPFASSTRLIFNLSRETQADILIFNSRGQLVARVDIMPLKYAAFFCEK